MEPIATGPGKGLATPINLTPSGVARLDTLSAAVTAFLGQPRRGSSGSPDSAPPAKILNNLRTGLMGETVEANSTALEPRDAKTGLLKSGLPSAGPRA